MPEKRILFVCSGNTCRSLMAESIAKHAAPLGLTVSSAGLRPQAKEDTTDAVEALRVALSIDASSHVPRSLDEVDLAAQDIVVAMDKWISSRLPQVPESKLIVWDVEDPWGNDPMGYRRCAILIEEKVRRLISDMATPG